MRTIALVSSCVVFVRGRRVGLKAAPLKQMDSDNGQHGRGLHEITAVFEHSGVVPETRASRSSEGVFRPVTYRREHRDLALLFLVVPMSAFSASFQPRNSQLHGPMAFQRPVPLIRDSFRHAGRDRTRRRPIVASEKANSDASEDAKAVARVRKRDIVRKWLKRQLNRFGLAANASESIATAELAANTSVMRNSSETVAVELPSAESASLVLDEELRVAFDVWDVDGSGTIDIDELRAIFRSEADGDFTTSAQKVETLFAEFDANGDGVLQFEEFQALWAALAEDDAAKQGLLRSSLESKAEDEKVGVSVVERVEDAPVILPTIVDESADVKRSDEDDVPILLSEDEICLLPGDAITRVEVAPDNARRIFSAIDIFASVDDVWNVLTAYDELQNVVPNLLKNEVIERVDDGCRMMQVGSAELIPGISFRARCTLDVREYPEGIPKALIEGGAEGYDDLTTNSSVAEAIARSQAEQPLRRGVFPRPFAISHLPHRDLSMQSIEGARGDFDIYQGLWRLQPLPGCIPASGSGEMMRLSYAVELRPALPVPVRLLENRIALDLEKNLKAIRIYVEGTPRPDSEEKQDQKSFGWWPG